METYLGANYIAFGAFYSTQTKKVISDRDGDRCPVLIGDFSNKSRGGIQELDYSLYATGRTSDFGNFAGGK